MRWLSAQLDAAGVTQQQRHLSSLAELAGEGWDLVINCCGLGSRDLLPDPHCYPVRGQIMRVRAPWVNQCVFAEFPDETSYIIPNRCVPGQPLERMCVDINVYKVLCNLLVALCCAGIQSMDAKDGCLLYMLYTCDVCSMFLYLFVFESGGIFMATAKCATHAPCGTRSLTCTSTTMR
jgi:hypothetical protein